MSTTQLTRPEPGQRAFLAVEQLNIALNVLYELAKDNPHVLGTFITELEDADMRLSLLRPRVKLSKSLIHLSSEFGRTP